MCILSHQAIVSEISPFERSSSFPLPKKLNNVIRGLISTQYDDNECLVIYLLNYLLKSSEQKSDKN